ncbi:dephospho-CoA kinase [Marinimicrobium alkaliphilum]|uniref:dephospho-CoA kinase n=1 Tax=Marinimicrobium alkaliphilum TaxID=2202654 RepID=UPI000DB9E148|nr:dephospho-CoA kinase [Marinimicrobium alkaliphilum]
MTWVVGITGGIGSGKSAATRHFQALGIEVVDADALARVVVEPGRPALATIAGHFGGRTLTADGQLNRPYLRDLIFSDPSAKQWLEQLLHPLIRTEIVSQLNDARSPYAILSSPLLLETDQHTLTHRIAVVDLPEALQIERASQRDGNTPAQIEAIMANQLSRAERLARADDVIDNSGSLRALKERVENLHERYLAMASATG